MTNPPKRAVKVLDIDINSPEAWAETVNFTVNPNTTREGRNKMGRRAEKEFKKMWMCGCGGKFKRVSNKVDPDYTCRRCKRRVEVKSNPNARGYGSMYISRRPLERMDPYTTIAWDDPKTSWCGILRYHAQIIGGPYPPRPGHDTEYYEVGIGNFVPLTDLGIIPNVEASPLTRHPK